jgi:hypothetical protein
MALQFPFRSNGIIFDSWYQYWNRVERSLEILEHQESGRDIATNFHQYLSEFKRYDGKGVQLLIDRPGIPPPEGSNSADAQPSKEVFKKLFFHH